MSNGFGLGDDKRKRSSGFLKRAAGYASAVALTFFLGAASEYVMHNDIQQKVDTYRGVPAEIAGDNLSIEFDEASCQYRRYLNTQEGRTELAPDNLPADNSSIVGVLYNRGLEKPFFAKAAEGAPGEYPHNFAVMMAKQGMSRYPDDIELPMSVTLPAAWRSLVNESSDAIKEIPGIDYILK